MIKTILFFWLLCTVFCGIVYSKESDKPIVIITQDGEVDDRSSFVRFLLYSSDIDLRWIMGLKRLKIMNMAVGEEGFTRSREITGEMHSTITMIKRLSGDGVLPSKMILRHGWIGL